LKTRASPPGPHRHINRCAIDSGVASLVAPFATASLTLGLLGRAPESGINKARRAPLSPRQGLGLVKPAWSLGPNGRGGIGPALRDLDIGFEDIGFGN